MNSDRCEAADEIRLLKTVIAELLLSGEPRTLSSTNDTLFAENERLRAEIERLRERVMEAENRQGLAEGGYIAEQYARIGGDHPNPPRWFGRVSADSGQLPEDLAIGQMSKNLTEAADEIKQLRDALQAVYEYIDHATGALPIIRATLGVGGRDA